MDDLIRKVLEVIFCRYSYDLVAKKYSVEGYPNRCDPLEREHFMHLLESEKSSNHSDYAALLYSMYETNWLYRDDPEAASGNRVRNVFHTLIHFTDPVLRIEDHEVLVRFEQILRWRELSSVIGEELLVSSFLAAKDILTGNIRDNFAWSTVCACDDRDLRTMAEKSGNAELHFHLKGSADNFEITWLSLMNHIRGRSYEFRKIEKCLSTRRTVTKLGTYFSSAHRLCVDAARIRLYLYRSINKDYIPDDFLRKLWISDESSFVSDTEELQWEIDCSKFSNRSNDLNRQYDYAIQLSGKAEPHILQSLSGERRLIYSALRRIYSVPTDSRLTYLLYRYLLAKAQLREEFVQVNDLTGFSNFSEFEKRKDIFIENYPSYKSLITQIAINGSAYRHNVSYIEARITPKECACEIAHSIKEFDRSVEKGARSLSSCPTYAYIMHFIKQEDKRIGEDEMIIMERHHALRSKVRKQVQAIIALRRQVPSIAGRIVALDAANNEKYCRPEVFSQAFRYARQAMTRTGCELPDLRYTFHAGEVYYEIVDGLRAIDEAILFLQLEHGDRLGHCLALGIDPDNYYTKESKHAIAIPEQSFLDNLVWLHYAAKKYNIELPCIIQEFIIGTYEKLFRRIYGPLYSTSVTMRDYYHSMQLRGDDPFCYVSEDVRRPSLSFGDWTSCSLNHASECCEARKNSIARSLYKNYHFNKDVRIKGEVSGVFIVPKEYGEVIHRLQDRMIDAIAERQLIIECCPTSNCKIGNFSRYDSHPITRFFDVGLLDEPKHQLPVTINTDDQGIFGTSLNAEIATVALALTKKEDNDRQPLYTRYRIMRWIEEVRNNSWKYRFCR